MYRNNEIILHFLRIIFLKNNIPINRFSVSHTKSLNNTIQYNVLFVRDLSIDYKELIEKIENTLSQQTQYINKFHTINSKIVLNIDSQNIKKMERFVKIKKLYD